ncbi:protein N-terminal asparagine amidohydrolase isoform X1 [Amaranthus tricolor]|uniref:protein N-terminal asparagine amidohydrolase isoform X1 n=1 Tax=Amaranthus tricolor TaxID=29722 RepID=UPI0025872B15|nr:protein N-terminal asparagine amidohydrolase isoform X1 [Amaranthus tricolor]
MIIVGGVPFESNSTDQGSSDLVALMEHPVLVSTSLSFKAIPEKKFSISDTYSDEVEKKRHVYVFQREYATVDPTLVDLIGTDEATTCVGVVIRNRDNGMTSVAHMDYPAIVDHGLSQMLEKLVDCKHESEMDVHLIGGFEECPNKHDEHTQLRSKAPNDHSFPLCAKIIEAFVRSTVKFHIHTLFVLRHNTKIGTVGNALPIFSGFLVQTRTGSIVSATFDQTTRCPDELVRRIRVSASFSDSQWRNKLLETYDTQTDQFIIAPCYWSIRLVHMASYLQQLPDEEILHTCSTSPYAEAPDFIDNQKRMWNYLIQYPNWKESFKLGKPRIFARTVSGGWMMVEQAHEAAS